MQNRVFREITQRIAPKLPPRLRRRITRRERAHVWESAARSWAQMEQLSKAASLHAQILEQDSHSTWAEQMRNIALEHAVDCWSHAARIRDGKDHPGTEPHAGIAIPAPPGGQPAGRT